METWDNISKRYKDDFKRLGVLCEQQNYRCCYYCGVEMIYPLSPTGGGDPKMASTDHIIPRSQGGKRTYENEVASCRCCNSTRNDIDANTFYRWRSRFDDRQLKYRIREYREKLKARRKEQLRQKHQPARYVGDGNTSTVIGKNSSIESSRVV